MNSLGRKDNESKQSVFTKETLGVVLMLFSALCLVCLITREHVFYGFGRIVNYFLFGCFGYFAFVVIGLVGVIGFILCSGKKPNFTKSFKGYLISLTCLIALLGHIISLNAGELSYGEYLSQSYTLASQGIGTCTAGGLITALVAYWINVILSNVGSYVVLSIAILTVGYFMVKEQLARQKAIEGGEATKFRSSYVAPKSQEKLNIEIAGEKDYPIMDAVPIQEKPSTQKLFVTNAQDFAMRTKKDMAKTESPTIVLKKSDGGLYMGDYSSGYKPSQVDDMKQKLAYIKTPTVLDVKPINPNLTTNESINNDQVGTTVSGTIPLRKEERADIPVLEQKQPAKQIENDIPMYFHDESGSVEVKSVEDSAKTHAESFAEYADIEEVTVDEKVEPNEVFRPIDVKEEIKPVESKKPMSEENNFITDEEMEDLAEELASDYVEDAPPAPSAISDRRARDIFGDSKFEEKPSISRERSSFTEEKSQRGLSFDSRVSKDRNDGGREMLGGRRQVEERKPDPVEKPKKEQPPINRVYNAPPLDLLESYTSKIDSEGEDHDNKMEIICQTLKNFHIDAEPVGYIQGPSITRYAIRMPADVSVKKVIGYDDDLKMRLASHNGVRIQAPIPGEDLVGVEVSNKHPVTVGLRELLENSSGKPAKAGELIFAIGKDIVGNVITDNLAKGPHYLVAGATGSGKSVCLNVMIISLIMRYSPEDLRLILVDPKGVEFKPYEHIPHLMIDEIVTEPKKALAVLQWAYVEMERRYAVFKSCEQLIVDIDGYNQNIASDTVARMPRIVIVVDELSNLMETAKKELEAKILAIAQKARAAGIHLVLATQRPSVDVITGTIKANLPSRIALKLMNFADSNTIISEGGAEKLLGNGDMLYRNSSMSSCNRYQGAWLSDRERTNVVNYIKEHNKAYFDDELQDFLDNSVKDKQEQGNGMVSNGYDYDDEDVNAGDPIFLKALWLAVTTGSVAVSQLQRRFRLGYGRAGALVDRMERLNFVSGYEGSKARRVLITREEFIEKFGDVDDTY